MMKGRWIPTACRHVSSEWSSELLDWVGMHLDTFDAHDSNAACDVGASESRARQFIWQKLSPDLADVPGCGVVLETNAESM